MQAQTVGGSAVQVEADEGTDVRLTLLLEGSHMRGVSVVLEASEWERLRSFRPRTRKPAALALPCKNPFCGKPLEPKRTSGQRCLACAIYLRRNGRERPRSLTARRTA